MLAKVFIWTRRIKGQLPRMQFAAQNSFYFCPKTAGSSGVARNFFQGEVRGVEVVGMSMNWGRYGRGERGPGCMSCIIGMAGFPEGGKGGWLKPYKPPPPPLDTPKASRNLVSFSRPHSFPWSCGFQTACTRYIRSRGSSKEHIQYQKYKRI